MEFGVILSGGAIMPFILLAVLLVVGSAYAVVDFFFQYWMYFALGSAILLVIRTIIVLVRNYEKWQAFLYLIIEAIRIPLTYITLVWFVNDWVMEMKRSILTFALKAGVEGIFVLFFISIAIVSPWCMLDDDSAWLMPLIGVGALLVPFGLRVLIEYVNTGVAFPVELFSQLLGAIA